MNNVIRFSVWVVSFIAWFLLLPLYFIAAVIINTAIALKVMFWNKNV